MSESYSSHPLQAFGLAIIIEIVLLAVAAAIITWVSVTKPAQSEPIPIVLANEEQPPQPKPEPPKPKPKLQIPMPQVQPKILTPPPIAPTQVLVPTAFTEPVPPPPPPVPAASNDTAQRSAEYAAKVRAAVQAAHSYPPAAAALRYSGRVRVEFHLRNRISSESHLLIASGIGIIDHAALQAVQSAQYPEPPQELAGADLIYQVWVEFNR
jgi:protein TonB